jgi:RepB DNA-primase from phage plasmid
MPLVEPAAPLRLLRAGYAPEDWVAVFLKSYATNETFQRVVAIKQIANWRFLAWLRSRNAGGWNIYVSVNAVTANGRSRARDRVSAVRHVFLEADQEGPQVLARLANRSDLPPPSYLLHSSRNRVHVFWRVAGFDIARVEALQKQLAHELNTDTAATSCSQTTRLPGYFNHKRRPPELVTMDYGRVGRVYGPEDFPQPKVPASTAASSASFDIAARNTVERARRYVAVLPPAIQGIRTRHRV